MTRPKKTWRVLVFDEHLAVREGLRALLSKTPFTIKAMLERSEDLLQKLPHASFDVLLMEPRLAQRQDWGLLEDVVTIAPQARVLVYSESPHISFIAAAHRLGVRGFVSKRADRQTLTEGLSAVAEDRTYYGKSVAEELMAFHAQQDHPQALLDPQMFRIFLGLAAGRSTEAVAADLGLTAKTVRNLVPRIKMQLKIEREDFRATAERYGLIQIVETVQPGAPPLMGAQSLSEPRHRH